MRTICGIIIMMCAAVSIVAAKDNCQQILENVRFDAYTPLTDECSIYLKDLIIKGKDNEKKLKALEVLERSNKRNDFDFFKEILLSVNSIPVQQKVIAILTNMRDKRVLPLIAEFFSSPFFAVREAVILALKTNGDDRMYPYVIRLAKSDEVIHRIYALEALYHLYDNRFYEIIIKLLQDSNKSVRYFALECVAHNEIYNALPYVRTIASGDVNEEVRVRAITVLAALKDKAAYYVFVRSLSDYSPIIREATVDALSTFLTRETTIYLSRQLLNEREVFIKQKIIKSLIIAKNTGDIRGLQYCVQNEEHPVLRIYAAYALGVIRDERGIPILIAALQDSDYRVRAEAAHALGNFKGKATVVALLNNYEKEAEQYVKSAIVFSLKRIGDPACLREVFIIYTNEKDAVLRIILASTIEHIIVKNSKQY